MKESRRDAAASDVWSDQASAAGPGRRAAWREMSRELKSARSQPRASPPQRFLTFGVPEGRQRLLRRKMIRFYFLIEAQVS